MNLQYVRERVKQNLIFPPNIPNKRGNGKAIATATVIGFLIVVDCWNKENCLTYLKSCVFLGLLCLIIAEIIDRTCALFEEIAHLHSRYNDSITDLFLHVYTFPLAWIICSVTILAIFSISNENPCLTFSDNWISLVSLLTALCLLGRFLILERGPLHTSLQISSFNGLDYGSGMAHSFFHGYLRLMLPNRGIKGDKSISEFQKDYESTHRINFEVYKLFILIPLSQYCPPRLDSEFSPSIETCKELDCKEIDRAGVQNRVYKNPVYKITTRSGSRKYVCAEYATPVKTLQEVMQQNTPQAELYKKHRKEILLNFYLTLRNLLKEDADCCDLCEVIYYDDKDDQGNFIDVGGLILHSLECIKKNL